MAETIFSLFADSCATSCNKKSMNQGQSIYSNNKDGEICHFPTLFFFFDGKNMPFFFSIQRSGRRQSRRCTQTQLRCLLKRRNLGENACAPRKMQPEEKASDCDKPNTLCNRIFHFGKTDKEEKT